MLATVHSATLNGVTGSAVRVEVHVTSGIPSFSIVGLPDASCREARDRVRAAVISSGYTWGDHRITVNLAPSGIRKVGAGLDLAIAVGFLRATKVIPNPSPVEDGCGFVGELGLDGTIRHVVGAVPLCAALETAAVVVPEANAAEALVLGRHQVCTADTLREVVASLTGDEPWSQPTRGAASVAPPSPDLSDVRGNRVARFALEVAAAGGHHLLMVGPPGSGKTMLAERLPGVLGPLDPTDAIETTTVHSAGGEPLPPDGLVRWPPFRSPHHSISTVALVGGGAHVIRPGEISLAHNGVLFLDELGEFAPSALDTLRQPLERGTVSIRRANAAAVLPANVQLIAAMNPCPCGYAGSPRRTCRCTPAALARYARRVSGPLLDRFDLRLRVEATETHDLLDPTPAEPTETVAERVRRARARATARGVSVNRALSNRDLEAALHIEPGAREVLDDALESGRLSGRGLRRIKAVALTLDDLRGGQGTLDAPLVAHALSLRAELRFDEIGIGA